MAKRCFVISVIGEKGSVERKHADVLLRGIIVPAATAVGYLEEDVVRADQIDETGMITAQIVEAIQQFDMVVADLSLPNPNVYYELAVRHQTGKPIVHVIKDGVAPPFDVGQVRNVRFGEAEEAKKDLIKKLKAAEAAHEPGSNPITQAEQIAQVKASPLQSAEVLALLLEGMARVESTVSTIHTELLTNKRSDPLFGTALLAALARDETRNPLGALALGPPSAGTSPMGLLGGVTYVPPVPDKSTVRDKEQEKSPKK